MSNNLISTPEVIKAVKHHEDKVVIALTGEIDMKCSGMIKEQFEDIFTHEPGCVIVDMTNVAFMDSSGLAVLVGALKQARDTECDFRISGPCEDIRSVFEICRLETIFQIYDNIEQALS